jgi:CubicO group peptidase (beta-lactamase class C family)
VLGLDTERLEKSVQTIAALDGVECVLVARFGRLAAEGYFRGSGPNQLRNLKSVSKSVLSAVVGIAIEQGHLSIDDRIGDLLPSTNFAGDQRKAAITVGDLLTMRSGLESTSFGNYGMWISSRNWVASALARPLVDEPGTRMRYSTGDTHLLSAALTEATGESTLSFAQQHLFAPLGIDRVLWQRSPQGIYMGGNNLSMTARDMARFGQLYLDRGRWGDQQIVPWKWVDMSTVASGRQPSRDRGGYGYLWWLRPENERGAYSANGFGGQYIYISRADDLVVVIGSTETSKGRDWRRSLFAEIREGIVGSVLSRTPSEPLQEDDLGPTPR